jgi:hypothetical protein
VLSFNWPEILHKDKLFDENISVFWNFATSTVMKKFLLTLTAAAILTIAAQAQTSTGVQAGAVTGSAESSNGSWTVYHAAPVVSTSFIDKFINDSKADFTARLDAMEAPATSLPNGVVGGKGEPSFNHDGQAIAGLSRPDVKALESTQSEHDTQVAVVEYRKNIKSGKWAKFVNGE